MSADANKFWNDLARKSARARRQHALSPAEAQAEHESAVPESISEAEIERLVERVVNSRSEPPEEAAGWHEQDADLGALVPCLNRNPAPAAAADDAVLDEHRRKALGLGPEKKLSWKELETQLQFAREQAGQVLSVLRINKYPVDPTAIAASEAPRLQVIAADFADRFDGQLEYHASQKKFLLFVNTKYDALGVPERTRFSFAHELAHFFLEDHRRYLTSGGKAHASNSEFSRPDTKVEREADAFAAAMLMPERLFSPLVNEEELTLKRIEALACEFLTSRVSTAIRAVEVSHFPCAVAGIRDNRIAWQVLSAALVEGGCYPGPKGPPQSTTAAEKWTAFVAGDFRKTTCEQLVKNWFRTYQRPGLEELPVTEHFLPVPAMSTLVVLLTVPEDELFPDMD